MVILQFNKLIRNKWLWGVIAVLFCLMFVGEDIFARRSGRGGATSQTDRDSAGTLGGEPVTAPEFRKFADDVRGHGKNRDMTTDQSEVNAAAWRNLAAYRTAAKNGVAVSDNLLMQAIQGRFGMYRGFNFDSYRYFLAQEYEMTPEDFEASTRRMLVSTSALEASLIRSSVWASPMEVDQAVADRTDAFTVSVARFELDKAEADAVALDDAGLLAWYEKNKNSIALPELVKIRYVKYAVGDQAVQERMSVTEDDMRDYYDANVDLYTSADTNGVDVVKSFDEVRGEIEKNLREIEETRFYETNLIRRAYAAQERADGKKPASRLDSIAAEDGRTVETSDWFPLNGMFVEGFMSPASKILPGVSDFELTVSELDPDVEDLRYAVVSSQEGVWLIERAGSVDAHTPSFEEAKDKIFDRALADARADALKAKAEAVAAKGVEALLSSGDVTNGVKFVVGELRNGTFKDQQLIVDAATRLRKGEISGFVFTGDLKGAIVVCEDRVPGDPASVTVARSRAAMQAAAPMMADISKKWPYWNLERLGYTTTSMSSVSNESDEPEDAVQETASGEEQAE